MPVEGMRECHRDDCQAAVGQSAEQVCPHPTVSSYATVFDEAACWLLC